MDIAFRNSHAECLLGFGTYSEQQCEQTVSFKSNPSWIGLGSFYLLSCCNIGLGGVHATGSVLYYKLQITDTGLDCPQRWEY